MVKRPSWMRPTVLGWATVVLVAGLLGGWALRTVLSPPTDALDAPGYTLVTAEQGTVGQVLRLSTSAMWDADAVLANQAVGTVTGVDLTAGSEVGQGARLYSVDLRPVVVAVGAVPAFRDLSQGVRGTDVAQLQEMLVALGHSAGDPDGVFDGAVDSAVRSWQRQLGVTVDGVVRRGDVVFVPSLPARLALAPELVVGAALSGGEPTVQVLPASPVFTIVLPENQARLVNAGLLVDITAGNATEWSAQVTAVVAGDQSGSRTAELGGVDGAPICADDCARIPYGEEVLLPSVIHVVPEISGITVPAAAVITDASGRAGVVLESGEFQPVTVVAGASGLVVIEGIDAGTRVRTPGELSLRRMQ